jgi:hypothetical protein
MAVTIQGYGEVNITLTNLKGRVQLLRLHNIAYCPDFPTNLISLRLLEARGINWNHRSSQLVFYNDSDILGSMRRTYGQYVLEHHKAEVYTTFAAITPNQKRYSNRSREQQQLAWANLNCWHERMGHISLTALTKLGQNTIGV